MMAKAVQILKTSECHSDMLAVKRRRNIKHNCFHVATYRETTMVYRLDYLLWSYNDVLFLVYGSHIFIAMKILHLTHGNARLNQFSIYAVI